tara:strand:- start:27 stop:809 length:783 start_codon:yes stop_codon:yes gene_type:complete
MTKTKKYNKAGTSREKKAATKIQSLNRGKRTRKHTKRLKLYKNLPDDLQKLIKNKYEMMIIKLRKENNKLLLESVEDGNLENVKHALDNYANIEVRDRFQRTPLIIASVNGYVNIVKYLLKKGADINSNDEDGNMVVASAIYNGRNDVAKELIKAGGDVNENFVDDNASDPDHPYYIEISPLMLAASGTDYELVKLLIKYNADVEAQDSHSRTALDYAEDSSIIKLLRKHLNRSSSNSSKSSKGKDTRKRRRKVKKTRRH